MSIDIPGGSWSGQDFNVTNTSDFNGLIRTIDGRSDRARFYAALDLNRDGVISQAEAGQAIVFNTAGPLGTVNYDRTFQAATGPQDTSSKGLTFFVQDEIALNRLTAAVNRRPGDIPREIHDVTSAGSRMTVAPSV